MLGPRFNPKSLVLKRRLEGSESNVVSHRVVTIHPLLSVSKGTVKQQSETTPWIEASFIQDSNFQMVSEEIEESWQEQRTAANSGKSLVSFKRTSSGREKVCEQNSLGVRASRGGVWTRTACELVWGL